MKHSVPAQTENDLIDFIETQFARAAIPIRKATSLCSFSKKWKSSVTMNAISTELATL